MKFVIAAFLLVLLAPSAALAAGDGAAADLFWRVVNVVLLLAVLVVFARKPLQGFFRDRRDRIQNEVQAAAHMRQEAEERHARLRAARVAHGMLGGLWARAPRRPIRIVFRAIVCGAGFALSAIDTRVIDACIIELARKSMKGGGCVQRETGRNAHCRTRRFSSSSRKPERSTRCVFSG